MTLALEVQLPVQEEIRELQAAYFRCFHERDWMGLAELFTDDADCDMRDGPGRDGAPEARIRGRQAIGDYIATALSGLDTWLGGRSQTIEVLSPVSARASWLLEDRVSASPSADVAFRRVGGWSRLHLTYACVAGSWRIRALRLERLWLRVE